MKKGLFISTLIFLLCVSLAACAVNKPEKDVKDIQPLAIGVMPDLDSIPLIIAGHNGYFEEEGIKVDIQHFKSAVDRDSALQTGNLDGAISDMLAVAFFNDNNFNVKITSKTDGDFKLIAGKNTNIEKTVQVKGKSIGISKNTIIEYLTDKMLEASNINPDEIEKVVIPKIPERLEMLKNNKLDAAVLPEPLASVAVSSGGIVLSDSDELGINPGVMIFTQKAIDAKKDEIKAFYRAYNKAIEYLINENREKYIDIIIKEAGFPESVRDSLTLPGYTKAVMPSEKELEEVIEWLKSKNLVTNDFKYDDLSDSSVIK